VSEVVGLTIWVVLKTKVSANIVPAGPEEIYEMYQDIKKGKRVYDALGRDVTDKVIAIYNEIFGSKESDP
jgi:hypothetical protein